jgi:hypothetical protein
MHLLNTRHYRLPVRRYVYEIFDTPLDVDTAKSIAEAGAGIKRRDKREGDDADGEGGAGGTISLSSLGIRKMTFSDDDDDDGGEVVDAGASDESELDDEAVVMPKEILDPALVVRGFVVT